MSTPKKELQKQLRLASRFIKNNKIERVLRSLKEYPELKSFVYGDNSIIWNAYNSNRDCLKELLNYGIEVDVPDSAGSTVLMSASANGEADCVRLFIECGCDVNKSNDSGETAFSYACTYDSLECAKLLFAANAQINTIDKGNGSPLDWTIDHASIEFRDWLTSIGGKHNDTLQA